MQRTIVLVKPDALQRGLVGEIIHRFEIKGLKLIALKMVPFGEDVMDIWYSHIKDRPFFPKLKSYMTSTPVVAMIWEGIDCVATVRKMVGITKGREAEMGSIRGDFAMSGSKNVVHASDSPEASEKEIKLIFKAQEIFDYKGAVDALIYADDEI